MLKKFRPWGSRKVLGRIFIFSLVVKKMAFSVKNWRPYVHIFVGVMSSYNFGARTSIEFGNLMFIFFGDLESYKILAFKLIHYLLPTFRIFLVCTPFFSALEL